MVQQAGKYASEQDRLVKKSAA
jgi:transposase